MRAIHVSVSVVPVRGALSHGDHDLLKFFIIIIIIIVVDNTEFISCVCYFCSVVGLAADSGYQWLRYGPYWCDKGNGWMCMFLWECATFIVCVTRSDENDTCKNDDDNTGVPCVCFTDCTG